MQKERERSGQAQPIAGQGLLELRGLGEFWLVWSDRGLVGLHWAGRGEELPGVKVYKRIPPTFGKPLRAYAAGDGVDPTSVPIDLRGTDFQKKVWAALRAIPLGTVKTYGAIAAEVGRPRASRAVGMANGANPVSVVVPCHRVVAAGLSLGGYSAGLANKVRLLEHEGVKIEGEKVLPGQLALFG